MVLLYANIVPTSQKKTAAGNKPSAVPASHALLHWHSQGASHCACTGSMQLCAVLSQSFAVLLLHWSFKFAAVIMLAVFLFFPLEQRFWSTSFLLDWASVLTLWCPACRAHQRPFACEKLHFKRLIFPWTDPSLGNCSYLDTCRHMKGCKYIHYELDDEAPAAGEQATVSSKTSVGSIQHTSS